MLINACKTVLAVCVYMYAYAGMYAYVHIPGHIKRWSFIWYIADLDLQLAQWTVSLLIFVLSAVSPLNSAPLLCTGQVFTLSLHGPQ